VVNFFIDVYKIVNNYDYFNDYSVFNILPNQCELYSNNFKYLSEKSVKEGSLIIINSDLLKSDHPNILLLSYWISRGCLLIITDYYFNIIKNYQGIDIRYKEINELLYIITDIEISGMTILEALC